MGNFVGKIFNKLTSTFLNLIVICLSAISILALAFLPTFKAKTDVTFTEDVAKVLFPEQENPTKEDEVIQLVAKELVAKRVTLHFEIAITVKGLISCSFDSSNQKTRETLYSFTDKVAESVDDDVIDKVETAVMKASVTTIIKTQIQISSDALADKSDEVMQNIGVTDEYVEEKTADVLNSIRQDGATVDSVTDAIMNVVDDVDNKLQNSSYSNEVESLTEQNRAEIREEIETLVNSLADENGNIDGNSLIVALLSSLSTGSSSASASPSDNATFALIKNDYLFEQELPEEEKTVDQILKEKLRLAISDEVVNVAKLVFLAITVLLAIVAFAWAYLVLKILLKMHSKNPLIKLKAPISVSWIPFAFLFALPSALIGLLSNPPTALASALNVEGFTYLSTLAKAVKMVVNSSSVIPFVLSIVLFVFGFLYSARRKAISKDLKKQKNGV